MREVVAFFRVQLLRTFAGPASARRLDRRNRIQGPLEDFAVVDVRRSKDNGKWEAERVGQQVVLGARLAAIGRIRPDLLTPFLAGTVAESTHARDQSMAPHRPSRSSRFLKSSMNTPAFCQSRKRRQHVTPLPYPSSLGSFRHGIPVLSTALARILGLPPLSFDGSGGNNGSIISQSPSLTSSRSTWARIAPKRF
jgi:hypothetical protein